MEKILEMLLSKGGTCKSVRAACSGWRDMHDSTRTSLMLHAAYLINQYPAETVLLDQLQAMLPLQTRTQILNWFANKRNRHTGLQLSLETASQGVLDMREVLRKKLQPPKQLQDTTVRIHLSCCSLRGFGFV